MAFLEQVLFLVLHSLGVCNRLIQPMKNHKGLLDLYEEYYLAPRLGIEPRSVTMTTTLQATLSP